MLGGAAVAAGTIGVLMFVFDTPSAEGVKIAPSIGNHSTGIVLGGTF
ncbi:hypothetical protein BH11MYX3_BH11MYX3_34310 [soil metagenome]